jgi:hypothetical protein
MARMRRISCNLKDIMYIEKTMMREAATVRMELIF